MPVALPLLLALEIAAQAEVPRVALSRDESAALAALVADDLRALLPDITAGRLALAGALFDPAELLRPGFPVLTTLEELARRVPRGTLGHVIAFGTHDGALPAASLQPDATLAQGPLRLLPCVLLAPAEHAKAWRQTLESELAARGAAGTATADRAMRAFGTRLAHARYLTRDDLLALLCVQYEHAGLAPLWTLLEAALLTPYREESTRTARGLDCRYRDGAVLVGSPHAWLLGRHGSAAERAHEFAGLLFELRQYAALLRAHGLPLRLADDLDAAPAEAIDALIETLAPIAPQGGAVQLFAHEAPALGVVAVTAAQCPTGTEPRVLAHGYPLAPGALGMLAATLAARYDTTPDLIASGTVTLDAAGALGVPAAFAPPRDEADAAG